MEQDHQITTEEILNLSERVYQLPYSFIYARASRGLTFEDQRLIREMVWTIGEEERLQAARYAEKKALNIHKPTRFKLIIIVSLILGLIFRDILFGVLVFIGLSLIFRFMKTSDHKINKRAQSRLNTLSDKEAQELLYQHHVETFQHNLKKLLSKYWKVNKVKLWGHFKIVFKQLRLRAQHDYEKKKDGFDPYQILGVDPTSDQETIKKAFRKKASEYHPDTVADKPIEFQELAQKMMTDINRAYKELGGS